MSVKSQIQMSFIRAFYGDGRDIDRAMAAWTIHGYWQAVGQKEKADCFDAIAQFYFERHKKAMSELKARLLA